MKKLFYLQLSVIAVSITAAVFATPILYKFFPDDYQRLSLINEWSSEEDFEEDIVIFGSSMAMNGIDGHFLSELYDGAQVASFTNPGQSFTEALLFYPKIKDKTKIIIQCTDINSLQVASDIAAKKANKLIISGYELSPEVHGLISGKSLSNMTSPKLKVYFESRDFIKNGLHSYLRKTISPNELSDSVNSKTYPYLFNYERAPETQYRKYLKAYRKKAEPFTINCEFRDELINADKYVKDAGIEYYIVLMPLSPIAQNTVGKDYDKELRKAFQNTDINLLDYTFYLKDEYFCDPTHLNRSGAKLLTQRIFQDIQNIKREHSSFK